MSRRMFIHLPFGSTVSPHILWRNTTFFLNQFEAQKKRNLLLSKQTGSTTSLLSSNATVFFYLCYIWKQQVLWSQQGNVHFTWVFKRAFIYLTKVVIENILHSVLDLNMHKICMEKKHFQIYMHKDTYMSQSHQNCCTYMRNSANWILFDDHQQCLPL